MDVSGTLKSVTIDGVAYDAVADVNITQMGSNAESEMIPSSGRAMRKLTKRVEVIEGVVLICNDLEFVTLKASAEKLEPFSMSITNGAQNTWVSTGAIEFESRESQDNRATIKMQPSVATGWLLFTT